MDSLAVMAMYTALFVVRFLQSSVGTAHWEELHTPTAAALLASGHPWSRLASLQYQPFCGGCTVETLAIYPTIVAFGSSLAIWKLVPLGFGLAIVALVMHIGRKMGGNSAARLAGLCVVFAPFFYVENRMIAWGNHFEVAAVILLQLVYWQRWMRNDSARAALVFGVVGGLGFWFCYSSAVVPPVLFALWMRGQHRKEWGTALRRVGLGLVVGLAPWLASQLIFQSTGVTPGQSLVSIYGLGPTELLSQAGELPGRLSSIYGPVFWHSAYGRMLGGETWVLGLFTAFCGVLVTGLMGRTLQQWWRAPSASPSWGEGVAGVTLCYTFAYIVLSPLKDAFNVLTVGADELRYLNPLIPLWSIFLGTWCTQSLTGPGSGPRRAAILAWTVPSLAAVLVAVSGPEMSIRPFWMTSARPVAVGARTVHDSVEPIAISEAAQNVKGHTGPQRVGRFVLGQKVAQQLVRDQITAADLDEHFQALEPIEARDVAAGIGHGLRSEVDWTNPQHPYVPGPRLEAFLAAVSEETGAIIASAVVRFLRPDVTHLFERLQMGWDPISRLGSATTSPPYAKGIARELGRIAALETLSRTPEQGASVRQVGVLLVRMKPPHRGIMMQGAGEVFGERFGHRPIGHDGSIDVLHHQLRAPYTAGFALGLRRTFWAQDTPQLAESGLP